MSKTEDVIEKMNRLNKFLGKDEMVLAKDSGVPIISTGSIGIDNALNGGFPFRSVVTLWGPYDSGKSTLALTTIANAQKEDMNCVYINVEGTFNHKWAKDCGVDTDKLVIWDANSFEEIERGLRPILLENIFNVIVIDSITDISTEKDFAENDGRIGIHAAGMSKLLRKVAAWNHKNSLIILISQVRVRSKGQFFVSSWSGGNAVDHGSSVIIRMNGGTKDEIIKITKAVGDKSIEMPAGFRIHWEVTKSKVSPKSQSGSFICLADGGIDSVDELVQLALLHGVVEKAGAWIKYEGESYQGVPNFVKALKENEKLLEGVQNGIAPKKE